MSKIILEATGLTYTIDQNRPLLDNINIHIKTGDLIGIGGKSGSGKTSLLHILSGLMTPNSGKRTIMGYDLAHERPNTLAKIRQQHIGFIFQTPNLMADFSPVENIALPLIIAGTAYHHAVKEAESIMESMGIGHLKAGNTKELSGGEKQRVNIARAIIHKPSMVFADEPTGSLDQENAENIQSILFKLTELYRCALILVSHDQQFVAKTTITYTLDKGLLHRL